MFQNIGRLASAIEQNADTSRQKLIVEQQNADTAREKLIVEKHKLIMEQERVVTDIEVKLINATAAGNGALVKLWTEKLDAAKEKLEKLENGSK